MDEKLASAISHWGPRFTTNGITVADFEKVTSSIDTWSQWCQAWSQVATVHEDLGRTALADGRTRSAGEHLSMASTYFHFAKFVFVEDYEQMRTAHVNAVRCLTDALPHLDPPGRRVEVPFEGSTLVGILRTPAGSGPHPAVLLIPGLDSTKEEFRSTEKGFLDRALATFSVDGPGQGEAEYDLPIRGDWSAPGLALLDALAAQPEVDGDRLAVWGVSLGGYYSPRVAAAAGDRIRAAVALAGPYNFGDCWDQLPQLTRDTFRVRSQVGTDDEARANASTLDLTKSAREIGVPLLVVTGRLDRLIPYQHAERLADEAPHAELLLLDDGNHGCMNVWPKHRPYTADWLAARLHA
jgi:dipeptidyl aminopeptidase/acylaminoacyl peptidase